MYKKMIAIGIMLMNFTIAQNISDELYQKGIDGDIKTQVQIGNIYFEAEDKQNAKIWWKKAALQNDPEAQYLWAKNASYDEYDLSNEFFRKAAAQNYAPAQVETAWLYFYEDTEKDNQKGLQLLNAAVEQNNDQAQAFLGDFYLKGQHGVVKNIDKGLKYLALSAEQNNTYAYYYLGDYYLSLGTDDGNAQALNWFKRITDKNPGFGQASSKLAQMYTLGLGVPKDIEKAKDLLRPVISIYFPDSIYSMGLVYAQSNDLNDQKKALGYLRKACWENIQISCDKVQEILGVQNEK
ncbi:hypothetical protein GCM10023338_10660 [Wohlfahrtiimonas larvae]|uniref:Sel1 repeat family protein n=2 Tax=Wohlfahrtiimonas larvae TaxID=1157986 RepID=A0ABP9MM42_9GAMM